MARPSFLGITLFTPCSLPCFFLTFLSPELRQQMIQLYSVSSNLQCEHRAGEGGGPGIKGGRVRGHWGSSACFLNSLGFSPSSSLPPQTLCYSPQLPPARFPLTGEGEPHSMGGERHQSQCQGREPRVGLWHLAAAYPCPPCIMPFAVGHSGPTAGAQPWTLGQYSSRICPPSPRSLICKAYVLGHKEMF